MITINKINHYYYVMIYFIINYYYALFIYYYLIISSVTIINKPHSSNHFMNPQIISIAIHYSPNST